MSKETIRIAAAGDATRMQHTIAARGYPETFPKSLLPTGNPNDERLLDRIVQQARAASFSRQVIIYANEHNVVHMRERPEIADVAALQFYPKNTRQRSSFQPFITSLLTGATTLGCNADFYADLSWDAMLDAHDSSPYPVTFAVGRTIPGEQDNVFEVGDTGKITGLENKLKTEEGDYANVGVYIFEPSKLVMQIIGEMCKPGSPMAPEAAIVGRLIEQDLLGAYVLPGTHLNVNTPETYQALLQQNDTNEPAG